MSEERLTPERAVRLLRAKAGELETYVLNHGVEDEVGYLKADLALVVGLLADHMELADASRRLYEAHVENLIERVAQLEQGAHYHTKTGKVLTNEDIEALADEAERGYDVSHLIKDRSSDGARGPAIQENFPLVREIPKPKQEWGPDHPDYDEMGQ